MHEKFRKPLHILVDGADKLGKSTVVQMLSRHLDLPIIRMPRAPEFIRNGFIEDASKLYNETIIQFAEYDFIMDRGFTSSLVYAKVFGRNDDLEYIRNIDSILQPRIFILTGIQKVQDDIDEMNERWGRINHEFKRLPYLQIDVDGLTPIDVCNRILESL